MAQTRWSCRVDKLLTVFIPAKDVEANLLAGEDICCELVSNGAVLAWANIVHVRPQTHEWGPWYEIVSSFGDRVKAACGSALYAKELAALIVKLKR